MHIPSYLAPRYSYGWAGGRQLDTRIVTMRNGRERRNANWDQPLLKVTAPYQHISDEAWGEIDNMILVCRAQTHSFLFQHPKDYEATNEQFGVGDGVRTTWRLTKRATVGSVSFLRQVSALYTPEPDGDAVQATPVITKNATPTTALTVRYSRAEIVFDVAPADGEILRWSGFHSYWVRFASDYMPFSFDQPQGTYGSIDLLEVPPPEVEP